MVSLLKSCYLTNWSSAFENIIDLAGQDGNLIDLICTFFVYFCEDVVNWESTNENPELSRKIKDQIRVTDIGRIVEFCN